jgi:hypothetical protein
MMQRTRITVVTVLAGLVAVTAAWVCMAAPIVVGQRTISGEVRSLANLKQVRVAVSHTADVLNKLKYSTDEARKDVIEILATADIAGVDDDDAPLLNIEILIEDHPKYPDVFSYTFHVSLEQKARIERLNEIHVVPTYAFVHGDLVDRGDLRDELDKMLAKIIDRVINRIRRATRERAALSSDSASPPQ